MNLKATLLRLLKVTQAIQYESFVCRTLLESLNPPNWRTRYAELMKDEEVRQHHYDLHIRQSVEAVEREENPDKVIQALLQAFPTHSTDKVN
jgi:enoyl reductase-like protein